ncbi:MAG: hypothetical protein QOJ13_1563 [Gaiellales bacterium]|nr:hypothetical protein [Gaiellales bacterium]
MAARPSRSDHTVATFGGVDHHPESSPSTGSIHLTIRRRVSDFEEWRRELDARIPEFTAAGVVDYALSRMLDDPNEVELVLGFRSVETAQEMARRVDLPETHERVLLGGALEIGSMSLSEAVVSVNLTG